MTYRTTAAYPYVADADRAVAALRGNVRVAAARDDAAPDWSSIRITPMEVIGARGIVWYEWAAAVDAHGAARLPETVEPRPRQRPARGSRTGARVIGLWALIGLLLVALAVRGWMRSR